MDYEITDNRAESRFEVAHQGHTAVLGYEIDEPKIVYTHASVPEAIEGQGVGTALAEHAVVFAQERGYQIVPRCSFIRAYLDKHPRFDDIISDDDPEDRRQSPSGTT